MSAIIGESLLIPPIGVYHVDFIVLRSPFLSDVKAIRFAIR